MRSWTFAISSFAPVVMMVYPLRLSDHRPRVFIIAQSDELRVSQMVSVGPLNKLHPRHRLRFHPHAFLHLFCGESLSPSPCRLLWKVHKGATVRPQVLDLLIDLLKCSGYKARPHSPGVHQVWAPIEADYKRIDSEIAGHIA